VKFKDECVAGISVSYHHPREIQMLNKEGTFLLRKQGGVGLGFVLVQILFLFFLFYKFSGAYIIFPSSFGGFVICCWIGYMDGKHIGDYMY